MTGCAVSVKADADSAERVAARVSSRLEVEDKDVGSARAEVARKVAVRAVAANAKGTPEVNAAEAEHNLVSVAVSVNEPVKCSVNVLSLAGAAASQVANQAVAHSDVSPYGDSPRT